MGVSRGNEKTRFPFEVLTMLHILCCTYRTVLVLSYFVQFAAGIRTFLIVKKGNCLQNVHQILTGKFMNWRRH